MVKIGAAKLFDGSVRKTKGAKSRPASTEDQALAAVHRTTNTRERQAEKEAIAAERRAIKKAARRHLKQQLFGELEENERI